MFGRSQPLAGSAAHVGVREKTIRTSGVPLPSSWREARARSCSRTPWNPAHGGLSRMQPLAKICQLGWAPWLGCAAAQSTTSGSSAG